MEINYNQLELLKTKTNDFVLNTLSNDWCGLSIFNNHSWEPHISNFLKRNIKSDSILCDVGSNYGWHSIQSSFFCESVYSFEPQKYIHDIQKKSIEENNIENIKLFNFALGDENGTKEMSPIDYNSTSTNMGDLSLGVGGEKIEVRTLDSMNISRIDFMKIDVQGYEKFVLKGGENTLKGSKPIIIIEMENHQCRRFNYDAMDLFEIIRNLGYHIYYLDYFYPSDHVCVHKDMLNKFIEKNKQYIVKHNESNNLNHNFENGITEKII